MKKNKLLKTGALALGTVASIAAPIAAVVSCGGLGDSVERYNTAERSTIELDTTFSSTGPQFKTLDALVTKYNALTGDDRPANFKPVKLVHVEGGYGTIPSQLKVKFLSKTNEIPNLFIDYADAAGRIAWDGMDLDLKDAKGQLDPTIFNSINDNIGGVKQGEDVILPIAQSAEMMTINAPLLNFLVKAAGGTFDSASEYGKQIEAAATPSKDFPFDGAKSTQGWKGTDAANPQPGLVVKDSDFESYTALFALAKKLGDAQGLNEESTKRVLGLDSAPNALYEMAYSKAKGVDSDFIYSKSDSGDYVDYNLFTKTPQTNLFKNTIKQITDAVSTGSTKIYGGGAYASSDTTYHQLAMSIGSTAGYSHNFVKATSLPTLNGTDTFQGFEAKIETAKEDGNEIGDPIFVNGSHNNAITTDLDNKYGFHVDADSLAAAKTFLNKNTSNVYLVKGTELPKGSDSVGKVELKLNGKVTGHLVIAQPTKISAAATTLQKEEMISIPAPTKDAADGTEVAFLQGPGLIGVHNNEVDDNASLAFSKWFTGKNAVKVKLPFATDAKDFASPLAAWSQGSEYAVAVEGDVLGKVSETEFPTASAYTKGNYFVSKLIDRIDATDNTKISLLSPAADEKSGVLRTILDASLKKSYDDYHGKATLSSDSIYSDLRNTAIVDNIIG